MIIPEMFFDCSKFEEEAKFLVSLQCLISSVQLYHQMPIIDALPQQICGQCYRKLIQWTDFRKLCRQSDKTLQSFVAMDTDEEIDNKGDDLPLQSDEDLSSFASDSQSEDLTDDENEIYEDFMDNVALSRLSREVFRLFGLDRSPEESLGREGEFV